MLILAPKYTAGTYIVSNDWDLFLLTIRITMLTENLWAWKSKRLI